MSKQMSGDITLLCGKCGQPYLLWAGHVCPERQGGTSQRGWVCPVCGRGNAPWNGQCDCAGVGNPTEPGNTATFRPWPVTDYPNTQSQTLTADELFKVGDDD